MEIGDELDICKKPLRKHTQECWNETIIHLIRDSFQRKLACGHLTVPSVITLLSFHLTYWLKLPHQSE